MRQMKAFSLSSSAAGSAKVDASFVVAPHDAGRSIVSDLSTDVGVVVAEASDQVHQARRVHFRLPALFAVDNVGHSGRAKTMGVLPRRRHAPTNTRAPP